MKKGLVIIVLCIVLIASACNKSAMDGSVSVDSVPIYDVGSLTPVEPVPTHDNGSLTIVKTVPTPPEPIPTEPLAVFEMSDDLFDFTIKIDGDVLKLPLQLDVLRSYGWESNIDLVGTLLPRDTFSASLSHRGYVFVRDDKFITIHLANMSDELRYLKDSTFFAIDTTWTNVTIELPRGIQVGSSRDDVIAAFGEPDDIFERGTHDTLTFRKDWESVVNLRIDNESDHVIYINIENKVQIESDLISNKALIHDEVTDREKNYVPPTSLGNDFTSFHVEIAGDLYHIPAPVSAFLDNGWEFEDKPPEGLPAYRELTGVSLVKDGKRIDADLFNLSDDVLLIERCFVVGIGSYIWDSHMSIVLPGGVTLGTSEDELQELFGDLLKVDELTSSRHHHYSPDRYATIPIRIFLSVNIEGEFEGQITRITISNIEF